MHFLQIILVRFPKLEVLGTRCVRRDSPLAYPASAAWVSEKSIAPGKGREVDECLGESDRGFSSQTDLLDSLHAPCGARRQLEVTPVCFDVQITIRPIRKHFLHCTSSGSEIVSGWTDLVRSLVPKGKMKPVMLWEHHKSHRDHSGPLSHALGDQTGHQTSDLVVHFLSFRRRSPVLGHLGWSGGVGERGISPDIHNPEDIQF